MKNLTSILMFLYFLTLTLGVNAREQVLNGNWCNFSESFQVVIFNRDIQGGKHRFDESFETLELAKKAVKKEYSSILNGTWARQNSETLTLFLSDPIIGDKRIGKIVMYSKPICKWKDRNDLPKQK